MELTKEEQLKEVFEKILDNYLEENPCTIRRITEELLREVSIRFYTKGEK